MKKIFVLLFALVFLCSLAACTGTPHVGIDSSELEPFVIGGIGPLTEDRAPYGLSVYQGAKAAVDEINATGGVNGFRLVLNFQDSKGESETALAVYEKLLNNDMKVLLGGVYSDETVVLAEKSAETGLLMITPTASSATALGVRGNVFRVCFSDARLGTVAANFIADHRLADRVAVIWSDDVFGGNEQVQAFVSAFTARGGFADLYELPGDGPADFDGILRDLDKRPPQMIYLATSPADSRLFLKEYKWKGTESEVKIIGSSGLEGLLEGSSAPQTLEGMLVVTSFDGKEASPLVQNFVTNFTELHGSAPDRYAADAYDGIYAIAEAMKQAGITPENVDDREFNRKMVEAMTKISVHGVTGVMSWTADGETTRPASVKVVEEGHYTAYTKTLPGA